MKTRNTIAIIGLALSLSAPALAQDFSTGSSLMNTGSNLSSSVYGVGATGVDPMAGTANAPINRSRMTGSDDWDDTETDPGNPMPIGSTSALLLMAGAAAGAVALRKRREE